VNFDLNDDQRMLQEGAARYFEKTYDFKTRLERARHGGGFSRDTWAEFADMGWLAAAVPEDCGGLGFGPIELALLGEEFGRHLVLEPFTACGVLPAAIVNHVGDAGQREGILSTIASGESLFAVAHSEPAARGRVHHVECRAQRLGDGRWRLDGHKSVVVGATVADQWLVVARTGGEACDAAGVAVFVVPPSTDGVVLERCSLVDGTPAADLRFENTIVGPDALLGAEGSATPGLQRAIDEAIVVQCAEAVGSTVDVLALCSEYLKTRKQFGVPIGSFQALQHRMADMAIEASQARASLHRGLQALTGGEEASRSVVVSGVKAQVIKSARFVTQHGIQLHGGYGITEEYRVGHHWRRLLLADALFGSGSYHLSRYAEQLQRTVLVNRAAL
jgi:alkylation response protein AidB-like acyl-CoA dehydrogenase